MAVELSKYGYGVRQVVHYAGGNPKPPQPVSNISRKTFDLDLDLYQRLCNLVGKRFQDLAMNVALEAWLQKNESSIREKIRSGVDPFENQIDNPT